MGTTELQRIEAAIRAVAEASGGFVDALSLHDAICAHIAGRPIYWSARPYHDAIATVFLDLVHQIGLAAAIAEVGRRMPTHPQATPGALLLRLVPITASARRELTHKSAHYGLYAEDVRSAA